MFDVMRAARIMARGDSRGFDKSTEDAPNEIALSERDGAVPRASAHSHESKDSGAIGPCRT